MSYRKTKFVAGNIYHLYNRGVNRANIFSNADNYTYLLKKVKPLLTELSLTMIAYCLMPNHYHFVIRQDGDQSLSVFIEWLFKSYSQAYNKQQGRTGPLFSGRFKSIHVDVDSYVLHLCRYVHLNPVKAGLVAQPHDWPFSNYLEWIQQRKGTLVDHEFVTGYFLTPADYIEFVESEIPAHINEKLQPYLLE
ncbi:transposase [Anaerolineales bacterium HSG25]|nr:transposase [Anaerolineales bacterium HSG25]